MRAVPNTAVFRSSLISYFPGMLLRYCLSNFEMVPVATIFTSITYAFTLHLLLLLLLVVVVVVVVVVEIVISRR
jgi:hypothetical protein